MATRKETAAFILGQLGHPDRFSTKGMFGEFALYADGKPVAFICDFSQPRPWLPSCTLQAECMLRGKEGRGVITLHALAKM